MMNTKKIISYTFFLLAVTVSISMIGCSSSSGPDDTGNGGDNGGNQDPSPNAVEMVGTSFTPSNLTVEVGTTVTWTNTSSEIHTVTSGTNGEHDGQFDSGNIAPDGQFSYQFSEVGTYDYYCIPHVGAGMTGVVTVTESADVGY